MSKSRGGVFVQGDFAHVLTGKLFSRNGFHVVNDIASADVIVWTGGCDISPRIYGEEARYSYSVSDKRDVEDLAVVDAAWRGKKFMVGICRGAQLLNCFPNGGKLWQHVDCHNSDHKVEDYITGRRFNMNSIHHQMMRPGKDAVLLAGCYLSTKRFAEHMTSLGQQCDPEAIWYPGTRSLCIQSHPEFSHRETTNYFLELLERYYDGKAVTDAPPWNEVEDAGHKSNSHETDCTIRELVSFTDKDLSDGIAVEDATATCIEA